MIAMSGFGFCPRESRVLISDDGYVSSRRRRRIRWGHGWDVNHGAVGVSAGISGGRVSSPRTQCAMPNFYDTTQQCPEVAQAGRARQLPANERRRCWPRRGKAMDRGWYHNSTSRFAFLGSHAPGCVRERGSRMNVRPFRASAILRTPGMLIRARQMRADRPDRPGSTRRREESGKSDWCC